MPHKDHYQDYVADGQMLSRYESYQNKYRREVRDSDRVLIDLIQHSLGERAAALLDVGCSTGNLLYHIHRRLPNLRLGGIELSASSVEQCRADSDLADMTFAVHDMLDLPALGRFDAIVANAVAVYFDWADYYRALRGVFDALEPGGAYFAFEWLHPFAVQDLAIVETSEWHPNGLKFYFRPTQKVEALLYEIGFSSVEFHPFELSVDLPFPGYDKDVVTYTKKDEGGQRMALRGILYQPWCHMIARKG
jgi:SAM-dependent methyltransferase